ncbi:hypothetical protein LINPERHAP2_LOCUS25694, partial [Linum perenne]
QTLTTPPNLLADSTKAATVVKLLTAIATKLLTAMAVKIRTATAMKLLTATATKLLYFLKPISTRIWIAGCFRIVGCVACRL